MRNNEIADLLQGSQAAIAGLLGSLPAAVARWKASADEWSAQEVLGHMIETERRSFNGRIRQMLAEDQPKLADWDQVVVGQSRDDNAKELRGLRTEFDALRADSVALVRGLKPEQMQRSADHPYIGSVQVQELLYEWIYHDCDHLQQIRASLQAYVWPAMGSTQKFYTPPRLVTG